MNKKKLRQFSKFAKAPLQDRHAKGIEVSCKGKIQWWSMDRAREQADLTNSKRLIGDRKVRAYQCRINPNHFHIGRTKTRFILRNMSQPKSQEN